MGPLDHHLPSATVARLIGLAQSEAVDDTPAMNEIILRFEPLTRRITRSMTTSRSDVFDDVANACRAALVRAVRRHNANIPGFPAYAEKFMRGAALRELKWWQRHAEIDEIAISVSGRDLADDSDTSEDNVLDRLAPWGDGRVAEAIIRLSPSQRQITTMRYIEDAPLEAIALATGTSVSAVSQRLTTIHRRVAPGLAA